MKSKKIIIAGMALMCVLSIIGAIVFQKADSNKNELLAADLNATDSNIEESQPTETEPMETVDIADAQNKYWVLANAHKNTEEAETLAEDVISETETEVIAEEVTAETKLENTAEEVTSETEMVSETVAEADENTSVDTNISVEATLAAASMVIDISSEEYYNLCKIVECEAGSSCREGQIAVANVVINRVRDGRFPNTVNGVIYSPGQFTPVQTGIFYSISYDSFTEECVRAALYGEDYSCGALYFSSIGSAERGNWASRNLKRLGTIGGNVFFTYY